MNTTSAIVLLVIILIPAAIIAFLVIRMNRSQQQMVKDMKSRVSEFEGGPRSGLEGNANVISRNETLSPKAGNIAKVDLQMEIHLEGKAPYQVSTCWLVEVGSLDQVSPGKSVPVKVDPKKNERVFPNVPWARLWVFGK